METVNVDDKRGTGGSDGCEGAIFKGWSREGPIKDPEKGEGGKDEKSVDTRKELFMDLEQKTEGDKMVFCGRDLQPRCNEGEEDGSIEGRDGEGKSRDGKKF